MRDGRKMRDRGGGEEDIYIPENESNEKDESERE
jgi:hypothetical protein